MKNLFIVLLLLLTVGCGKDGASGTNGFNGETCAVNSAVDGVNVECDGQITFIPNGTDGTNGVDGDNGLQGQDGDDGDQGIQGVAGDNGDDGVDGDDGAVGDDGVAIVVMDNIASEVILYDDHDANDLAYSTYTRTYNQATIILTNNSTTADVCYVEIEINNYSRPNTSAGFSKDSTSYDKKWFFQQTCTEVKLLY